MEIDWWLVRAKVASACRLVLKLGAVAFALWGAVEVVPQLWRALGLLQPGVQAALLTGAFTILASTSAVVIGKYREQRLMVDLELRKEKSVVYQDFIDFWFKYLMRSKSGFRPMSEKEVLQFLSSMNGKLILWASDEVIRQYALFRRITEADLAADTKGQTMMVTFENFMLAMRRDLGHRNRGVHQLLLLSIFINDVETMFNVPDGASKDPEPANRETRRS